MTIDVIDLRDFYSQRLGIVARRLINRGIHARWPNAQGQRVLGLGYPTPYLGLFREDSERCIAFMPAAQGVLKWPTARPALATLIDEFSMPLPDAAVDRILLVHALEMSDDPERLLREVWRVLARCHDVRNRGEYEGDLYVDDRLLADELSLVLFAGRLAALGLFLRSIRLRLLTEHLRQQRAVHALTPHAALSNGQPGQVFATHCRHVVHLSVVSGDEVQALRDRWSSGSACRARSRTPVGCGRP
jgi:SAM-dependent methyltransferase